MCHSGELKKKGKLFHEKILQLEYFGHVKCFKFKMCVCVCVFGLEMDQRHKDSTQHLLKKPRMMNAVKN